ncbi:uncharacterized protein LOC111877581 [Lactuca sativa]|uniref:uncharacterized protein LOC111877581 n=1 Tax=Lactuca sativa TaxID=4236 RepID=UPI000CD8AE4B|nr:uncharacterized protein LOC111877581 [Lactuca sativa]
MDSHVSCRTPPLGLTTSINFNAADSDYRLPFHIQLRLLSNTSPTLATRLTMMTMTNSNTIDICFQFCSVRFLWLQQGYCMLKWLMSETYLTPYQNSRYFRS